LGPVPQYRGEQSAVTTADIDDRPCACEVVCGKDWSDLHLRHAAHAVVEDRRELLVVLQEVEHRLAAQRVHGRQPGLHRVRQLTPMLPMPMVAPKQHDASNRRWRIST
jgi:hypothetical protein